MKPQPEIHWTIPALLPEGLAIIAGKPKTGKSWLALNIATGVSIGAPVLGSIAIEKRLKTLYLALEDSERRLRARMDTINAIGSNSLIFHTAWAKGERALEDLRLWLQCNTDCKLVIVDTLARIREQHEGGPDYQADSDDIAEIKRIADHCHCTILVVHHTRKAAADDYMDLVSGTTGITGTADTIWILRRPRGSNEANLDMTGRDIEETEKALRFDFMAGGWSLLGDAAEHRKSMERQEVFRILEESEEAMSAKDIAEITEKKPAAVSYLLRKLVKEGAICQEAYGKYAIPHVA